MAEPLTAKQELAVRCAAQLLDIHQANRGAMLDDLSYAIFSLQAHAANVWRLAETRRAELRAQAGEK